MTEVAEKTGKCNMWYNHLTNAWAEIKIYIIYLHILLIKNI